MKIQEPGGDKGQEEMFQSIGCAVEAGSAIYISGPITTGLNFIEWYRREGHMLHGDVMNYAEKLHEGVIVKNEAQIFELARKTRKERIVPVIEPASLRVKRWSQEDYIRFWLGILERFVSEVVLVNGWQYSVGCVAEYNFSVSRGHSIYCESGEALTPSAAKILVAEAADFVGRTATGDMTLHKLSQRLRDEIKWAIV
jgi:hypothetical protein